MRPKVSIITPFFNAESLISKLIENIQAQTSEDWELLMIDDDSVDSGGSIAKKIASRDSRINVLNSPEDRNEKTRIGPWYARNYGLKNAKSDLVAFLDVDDLWHPQKLELQLELHENPNVHVTYTNYFTFDLSTRIINDYREFPPLLSFKSFLSHNPIPISTSMIKKSLVGRGFAPTFLEDYCFWLEVAKKIKGEGIRNVNKTLCYYGEHPKNRNKNKFRSLIHSYHAYLEAGFSSVEAKLCCLKWIIYHSCRIMKSKIPKKSFEFSTIDDHISCFYNN